MGQPGPAPPTYFVWVDALRGLAALSVVVFHYHHFYLRDAAGRPDIPETGTFPYAAILDAAYRHGGLAVEHFWVISGFVFAHVYLGRPTTMRAFWVARFARLYPLHLVTLLAVAALQAVSSPPRARGRSTAATTCAISSCRSRWRATGPACRAG